MTQTTLVLETRQLDDGRRYGESEYLLNRVNTETAGVHFFVAVPVPDIPYHYYTYALYMCVRCGAGFIVTFDGFSGCRTLGPHPMFRNCKGDDA